MSSSVKQDYMGEINSYVLHFAAYTGSSLEIYRVVTQAESLQTNHRPSTNFDRYFPFFRHMSYTHMIGDTKRYFHL